MNNVLVSALESSAAMAVDIDRITMQTKPTRHWRPCRRKTLFRSVLALMLLFQLTSSFMHTRWNSVERSQAFYRFASQSGVSDATSSPVSNTVQEFREIRRGVMDFIRKDDYKGAKELIRGMMEYLQEADDNISNDDRVVLSSVVDETFQVFFNGAFSPPYRGKRAERRVSIGANALDLQLSSNILESPYNQIPRRTILNGVKALTGIHESSKHYTGNQLSHTDMAYRLFQRLVTGMGVRTGSNREIKLYESDFNLVLNAYSNMGRMDMAHRIVALQERTAHAPSLSPVAYSILLKGYGRLRDLDNIQMLLNHAQACRVEPDVIMLNSLINAYVNCNELNKANDVFETMKDPSLATTLVSDHAKLFTDKECPVPNLRTYNIILKGLASKGLLDDAINLSIEMGNQNIWDYVTTNTLVQAAVKARDFDYAEKLLEERTESPAKRQRRGSHQNSEAYTTLIDGYAKDGDIKQGIILLQRMKERSVEPNEFTYTCLIGALAREKKIDQAKEMMQFMESSGLKVNIITYNSLLSGLLHRDLETDGDTFDKYVDSAIVLLREMLERGLRPNPVTIATIVGAFGKCDRPRVIEAVSLVDKLDADGVISATNIKIATSLVQVYGVDQDLPGALEAFRRIKRPDVASINALIHASLRSNNDKVAMKTFTHYFDQDLRRQRPDVATFTPLIQYFLKKNSKEGSKVARKFYEEMKYRRRMMPDTGLVDM